MEHMTLRSGEQMFRLPRRICKEVLMMKNVKRFLSALIAGALLCTGSVFSSVSAEETVYLRGDVDQDGIADSDDALEMILYYVYSLVDADGVVTQEEWNARLIKRGESLYSVEGFAQNDLDGDDRVTISDAYILLEFYSEYLLSRDADAAWAIIDNCRSAREAKN